MSEVRPPGVPASPALHQCLHIHPHPLSSPLRRHPRMNYRYHLAVTHRLVRVNAVRVGLTHARRWRMDNVLLQLGHHADGQELQWDGTCAARPFCHPSRMCGSVSRQGPARDSAKPTSSAFEQVEQVGVPAAGWRCAASTSALTYARRPMRAKAVRELGALLVVGDSPLSPTPPSHFELQNKSVGNLRSVNKRVGSQIAVNESVGNGHRFRHLLLGHETL
ncbi:hypothetical protein B0H13DRAFT_2354292 [Mycena leptocephala]|nr:hypothetical protein B0H13DRAFT_2354292 [Mycena leptocephala]